MRRKLRNNLAALCLSTGLLGLLFWLLTPPERNLFKRAQIVEQREDFVFPHTTGAGFRLQGDWPYCWILPSTLLTFHYGPDSITNLDPRKFDAGSGHRLPSSRLSELIRKYRAGMVFVNTPYSIRMGFLCLVSPDGARMLTWQPLVGDTIGWGEVRSLTVGMDAEHACSWRTPSGLESAAWMRNSHEWAGIAAKKSGYAISLFDGDGPPGARPREFDLRLKPVIGESPPLAAPALTGTLVDGRLLAVDWACPMRGNVLSARFFPESEAGHPILQHIPIPSGDSAYPIVPPILSPDGHRLAWFVSTLRVPPGWPLTRRFWSLLKRAPIWQSGLWTTGPDGGDPREVGHYTPRVFSGQPALLQWTPDGKCLSFRHEGALYKVPVE